MLMASPLVTVVVCVYNAGEYLRPAVESIVRQTYRNLEILVINDGSTDGCMESLRGLGDARVRILNQENRGRPETLNRALDEVRGEFYVIQDADDLSHPWRIEHLVAAMMIHPDVAAIFSGHEIILNGMRLAPRFSGKSPSECVKRIDAFAMPAHDPTGMFRMSMVGDLRYDPELPFTEAVDYILRVGEKFPLMVLGECLYSYRIHRSSITQRDPAARDAYVEKCLKKACARRGVAIESRFGVARRRRRSENELRDNNLAAHFIESSLDQRRAGWRWGAISTVLRCSRLHPLELHYHKALFYSLVPMWMVARLRRAAV